MKDCKTCIWYGKENPGQCGNYLCRNQSEYDPRREKEQKEEGEAVSDYVERDKAINAVFEAYADGRSAYIALETIPAADVRPVVRCRDCKFWFNAPAADGFNSCERDALIRYENFFCAAGEKREES